MPPKAFVFMMLAITTASGLEYTVTIAGDGPIPREGQIIVFHYAGMRPDGSVFEDTRTRGEPAAFRIGETSGLISGLEEGLRLLRAGDRASLTIPPHLAYGSTPVDRKQIPADATLRYEVEVLSIKSKKLSDVMLQTLGEGDIEAGRNLFDRLKADGFSGVYEGSSQLNFVGYVYLYLFTKPNVAKAVFEWNVELHPASANASDSLAEAYFLAGDREQALSFYDRAAQLGQKSSAKMLAKLRSNPKSPTELERLQMWMRGGLGEFDGFADTSRDIAFFQSKLEHYLLQATPAESLVALEQVEAFFEIVRNESSKAAKGMYSRLAESPLPGVRQAAALRLEAQRQGNQVTREVLDDLRKPIELEAMAVDGRPINLEKLRGKVVLLEFWTTWSPASARVLPSLTAAYEMYHNQGFEVIGISLDQAPATAGAEEKETAASATEVMSFARENRKLWPQYYDGKGWRNVLGRRFRIDSVPKNFLFDVDGVLVATDLKSPKLEQEIERLIAAARPKG